MIQGKVRRSYQLQRNWGFMNSTPAFPIQRHSWALHKTDKKTVVGLTSLWGIVNDQWVYWWWSGVVVSTLALINEVNLRRTRLVLRWVTVSGSIPGAEHLFQYVTNQPPKANSAFHPSGVGKWVPASAGKAKAGMVHSVSGWTRGVQVKLWDPLRTRAIPERLRGAFTSRWGAIQIHVYLYLYLYL